MGGGGKKDGSVFEKTSSYVASVFFVVNPVALLRRDGRKPPLQWSLYPSVPIKKGGSLVKAHEHIYQTSLSGGHTVSLTED